MTADVRAAEADLAFLRNLVEGGNPTVPGFGEAYFAAGLIYGTQMLLHAGQFLGFIPSTGALPLLVGLGPSVVFIPVMFWISWRHRKAGPATPPARAVSAVFGAVGLANFAFIAVVGSVAWREQSITTWLIYPCAVFILQGAAWFVAFAIRRRGWMALVGVGWFVSAIAMGATVTQIGLFVLFGGLGIWLCMALPGFAMLRSPRKLG
jgi:hypothetical protein